MSKEPVIKLRRISHNERLSQETNAYVADVYVDGKKFAEVRNEGMGGSDWVTPYAPFTREDVAALDRQIADGPRITCDFNDEHGQPAVLRNSLELVCAQLVEDHRFTKQFDRDLKSRLLMLFADGKLREAPLRQKGHAYTLAQVREAMGKANVAKNAGDVIYLQDLPRDVAFNLYRAGVKGPATGAAAYSSHQQLKATLAAFPKPEPVVVTEDGRKAVQRRQAASKAGAAAAANRRKAAVPGLAHEGEKSGAFIRRMIMEGFQPEQIVTMVHAAYPASKATKGDVSWNRAKLVKDGVKNVPAFKK